MNGYLGIGTSCSGDLVFENFHLLSEIRDGLDILNSQSVTVRDCFIMAHDDALCLKGVGDGKRQPVEDILAERCVLRAEDQYEEQPRSASGWMGTVIAYSSRRPSSSSPRRS